MRKIISLLTILLIMSIAMAEIIPVGSGSYTTSFPGVDQAGRNSYPSGSPQVSGPAAEKHPPTNDWWSTVIKENHAANLFNYPMAMKTINQGLVVTYIPWGVLDDQEPIEVGVEGLNASQAKVYDFSDWTVTMEWANAGHSFKATAGIGMPFLYFTKESSDVAQVTINLGEVEISNEMLLITDARNGADFIVYAPEGSTWTQNGSDYISTLNGNNYWSMLMLPQSESDPAAVSQEYKQYAYVFPQNTYTTWDYDEYSSIMRTEFHVEPDIKEGEFGNVLQGLLPHQWDYLSGDSPSPQETSYNSIRGELKMLDGNFFATENEFKGILPTLPYLANYSLGFNPADLQAKIELLENDELATWTDSYNEGQVMNRLIQTARIAHEMGDSDAVNTILSTVQERLEDWLTASSPEVAFIYYYHTPWSVMIGYPAGHGQDSNVNDHHFHWGYFIHAAAFVEQFNPGWASEWGEMVNLLVRDAASSDRDDELFPYLRSFSPFAGHAWANGFATFPQGNDQESSSESMQFNTSLIHWGAITENTEIRDLGIYLYTTEQTAIEEYWFDINERNLAESHPYSLVSRVWGNSYDNGTFWTSDIAASYGIEMYPIHGGSLYLGHHHDYVELLWNEITQNTGILSNEVNPNLWHDVMWKYQAFIDPQGAIELYDSYPDRELKFGISDAQTYYWLHSMNALGEVRADVVANYPIAACFYLDGLTTYVAHNYTSDPLLVAFSDGYELEVPAGEMATSRLGNEISGVITSNFEQAAVGGSVSLTVQTEAGGITSVAIFDGSDLLAELLVEPYEFQAVNLTAGTHNMYARVYVGEDFGVTNIISIQVGEQVPYNGGPFELPGTIPAGDYDDYEGGVGQGITYYDMTQHNSGVYRPDEYVDVEYSQGEGPTLGWTANGEWVEYSIQVETTGYYNLSMRTASGNFNGGGPYHFEINGSSITNDIYIGYTGDWYNWEDHVVSNVPLNEGEHILRVAMGGGEFNLGRMTFTYQSPLDFNPPVADAGDDIVVLLPESETTLDGSSSHDEDTEILNYHWEQIYGSSVVSFTDQNSAVTEIQGLIEGIYKFSLTVDDGEYSSLDHVYVYVSSTSNISPVVTITAPADNSSYYFGTPIEFSASASDVDGSITSVEFYKSDVLLALVEIAPFEFTWEGGAVGEYQVYAQATDDGGLTAVSETITITILEAAPCIGGPDNGHYTYEFSDDLNNPTLTFIPGGGNAGDPVCILYYSTGGTPPGYYVTPNEPFQVYANEGETITFYYTYSYNGMEHNTAADPHSYVIGSCSQQDIPGDLDLSGIVDILDVVIVVDIIFGEPATDYQLWAADLNGDGMVDILDIIMIVDIILGSNSAVPIRNQLGK